jgi:hypothetical protein
MELDLEVLPVRRRGRPSRYNPASCDRVLGLAAQGCGKAEIAAGLGVSVKTLTGAFCFPGEKTSRFQAIKEK